jgi:hypothetical protein
MHPERIYESQPENLKVKDKFFRIEVCQPCPFTAMLTG